MTAFKSQLLNTFIIQHVRAMKWTHCFLSQSCRRHLVQNSRFNVPLDTQYRPFWICQLQLITCRNWDQQSFLPRDASIKRGLRRHAVSVCLSVTFVDCVKKNKHIFEIFSPLRSQDMLVFPYQTACRYIDGTPRPLTGASNAGGTVVGRNRDS